MMKYITRLETNIPVTTSLRGRRSSPAGGPLPFSHRMPALSAPLLHPLPGLPEEEVWRDAGAEDPNQDGEVVRRPLQVRHKSGGPDGAPATPARATREKGG